MAIKTPRRRPVRRLIVKLRGRCAHTPVDGLDPAGIPAQARFHRAELFTVDPGQQIDLPGRANARRADVHEIAAIRGAYGLGNRQAGRGQGAHPQVLRGQRAIVVIAVAVDAHDVALRAVVEGINAVLALFDQAQPALKAPKREGLKGQFMQVLRVRPVRHGRHRVARRAPGRGRLPPCRHAPWKSTAAGVFSICCCPCRCG